MKTVYIIGSNGFLGKSLHKFFKNSKLQNIEIIKIKRNIGNKYRFPKKIKENSICINFASIIGKSCEENKNYSYKVNVDLNKEINQLNFKKIIFTSSASVYGYQDKICNERSSTKITNFYTETKLMAEEELLKRKENLILRLATCFGNQKTSPHLNIIDTLVQGVKKNKSIKIFNPNNFRPYIDINSFCRIMIMLIEENSIKGIYNLGLKEFNINKLQIIHNLKKIFFNLNYDIDYSNIDKRNYKLCYKKLYNFINIKKVNILKTFKNYYE